jgi:hypothetical protein
MAYQDAIARDWIGEAYRTACSDGRRRKAVARDRVGESRTASNSDCAHLLLFVALDVRSASPRVRRIRRACIAPVTQFALGFAYAANVPAATRAGPIRSRLLPRKSPRRVGK